MLSRTVLRLSSALCVCGMAAAHAQPIDIGYGPAGSIITVASGIGFAAGTGPDFGGFASALANPTPSLFSSFTTTGDATIWVTETDLPTTGGKPFDFSFLSGFTENLTGTGETITESTYADDTNAAYGTGTFLASKTFTATGSASVTSPGPFALSGPFSVTEEFQIVGAAGASTIGLNWTNLGPRPPIPETSTWLMLGLGFAGLGLVGYRARKSPRMVA